MSRFRRGVPARTSSNPRPSAVNEEEERTVEALDQLAEFEEYKQQLLPEIAKLVRGGAPTKDILNRSKALAVARLALIAVNDADSKTALSAIRDILDRTEGKVTEKREVTHAMANLADNELDALVITALEESTDDSSKE
jgi:hypothetical protein